MAAERQLTSLLGRLRHEQEVKSLDTLELQNVLEQLKVLGRQAHQATPLFEKQAISTIAYFGFENGISDASREALRCLANALLLKPATRQVLVDLDYAATAAARLRAGSIDDEFLCSRILMLLTYETNLDFVDLAKQSELQSTILHKCIERHAARTSDTRSVGTTIQTMALSETLSLTYNLINLFPPLTESLKPALTPVIGLLRKHSFQTQQPMDPPVRQLINVLLTLAPAYSEVDTSGAQVTKSDVELLLDLLDAGLKTYQLTELDTNVAPLVSLLLHVYKACNPGLRDILEARLLPAANERDRPLGKSDTLFSRIIKLSTSSSTPLLRDLVPQLMWELSNADPNTLVRNVGYGYASGFLVNKGFTSSDVDPMAGSSAKNSNVNGNINFVTGQYRDSEPEDTQPPMSDEEKEREAEKLFVLFERLKRTGVVDVENPVETAARQGRFEDLHE